MAFNFAYSQSPIMATKALLVCLLIAAVVFVEAGKHPKANKIKKGKLSVLNSI